MVMITRETVKAFSPLRFSLFLSMRHRRRAVVFLAGYGIYPPRPADDKRGPGRMVNRHPHQGMMPIPG